MKAEYVVLRSSRPSARTSLFMGGGLSNFPVSARTTKLNVVVENAMLDAASIESMPGDESIMFAPVMPMKLIEGLSSQAAPQEAGVAWGVAAVGAAESPFQGDGVVVAVLDTGIDRSHPAFANMSILEQDFTSSGVSGDVHGHGTHCAGTIFGRDVDGFRIGVAPGVKRALIAKVLGPGGGRSDQIVRAVEWAVEHGANVVSMSLGIDFLGYQKNLMEVEALPSELATSRALEAYRVNVILFERLAGLVAAKTDFGQMTLLIAAAGNESRTHQDARFKIAVGPPAVSSGFISVAALERTEEGLVRAFFSNTGADIAAPGVGITSAKLGGGLAPMDGTSMATPHVAGVAALWAEKLKETGNVDQLIWRTRLLGSATDAGLSSQFEAKDVRFGLVRAPRTRKGFV